MASKRKHALHEKRYSTFPMTTEQAIRKAMGVPEPQKDAKGKPEAEPEQKG